MADCYLMGVDLGTSSAKALVVGSDGAPMGLVTVDYPMSHPRPGWGEHDPSDFHASVVTAIRGVVRSAGVPVSDIVALAIVAQREPPVLLDTHLEPLMPSISWTDQRSAGEIERFGQSFGVQRYFDTVGLHPNAGSTLASLLWVKGNSPELLERTRHILTPKDYVLFRLTRDILTDVSTPGRSGLLDIRTFAWSDDVCAAAGLDRRLLPRIAARSSDAWGALDPEVARDLGLAPGTQIALGGGDDPSAAFGGGAIHEGDLCAGTGTASCWRIVSDARIPDPSGFTELAPHVVRDVTIREASITGTGSSMRWCRDELVPELSQAARRAGQDPYSHLISLAEEVEPGAGGVSFYPYLEGSLVPRFDPRATGVFHGITGGVTRRHLLRAVIEGITFQYAMTADLLRAMGSRIEYLTVVDGEAQSASWSQLKADVLGIEIRVPKITRAAGLGAAMLAGMAAGVFTTAEEAAVAMLGDQEAFYPDAARHERYTAIRRRYDEIYSHIGAANDLPPTPAAIS